jgi:hypothetical protein
MQLIARIILILACLLALPATAQTSGAGEGQPVFPRGDWPQGCWPAKAADVVQTETDYGWITAWWCADGTWRSVVRPKAPAVDALQMGYLESAVLPLLDKIKPVMPAWAVAPNGTSTTRPAYTLKDGKLYTSTTRATVGDACNCALGRYSTSATTVYCAIPQTPSEPPLPQVTVAVCKAK